MTICRYTFTFYGDVLMFFILLRTERKFNLIVSDINKLNHFRLYSFLSRAVLRAASKRICFMPRKTSSYRDQRTGTLLNFIMRPCPFPKENVLIVSQEKPTWKMEIGIPISFRKSTLTIEWLPNTIEERKFGQSCKGSLGRLV